MPVILSAAKNLTSHSESEFHVRFFAALRMTAMGSAFCKVTTCAGIIVVVQSLLGGLFLQHGLQNQAIRAVLREFACVTDHAVVAHQFIVVAGAIIGDGVRRTGIMPTGAQFGCLGMWQSVRIVFDITGIFGHSVLLVFSVM